MDSQTYVLAGIVGAIVFVIAGLEWQSKSDQKKSFDYSSSAKNAIIAAIATVAGSLLQTTVASKLSIANQGPSAYLDSPSFNSS